SKHFDSCRSHGVHSMRTVFWVTVRHYIVVNMNQPDKHDVESLKREVRMTNDECPMTKELPSPNDEDKTCERAGTSWTFVLGNSFDIRHSDFVIFRSHDSNAECGVRSAESSN